MAPSPNSKFRMGFEWVEKGALMSVAYDGVKYSAEVLKVRPAAVKVLYHEDGTREQIPWHEAATRFRRHSAKCRGSKERREHTCLEKVPRAATPPPAPNRRLPSPPRSYYSSVSSARHP